MHSVLLATKVPNSLPDLSRPRSDLDLLGSQPGVTVLAPPSPNWTRPAENLLAADVRHALAARRVHPDLCVSFTERLGAPAVFVNQSARHICIAHNFNRSRAALQRATGWMNRLESVVVVSKRQRDLLLASGLSPGAVIFVADYVDTDFFDPRLAVAPVRPSQDPYVLAVGQERRDYGLLLAAMNQLETPGIIVPSSAWVADGGIAAQLPSNVTAQTGLTYPELRSLYQGAAAVVVPVEPGTQYAAGVNGLLEAMAMMRPVIVTSTPGLSDYVDERFMTVVPAGDPGALTNAIRDVLGSRGLHDLAAARSSVVDSNSVEKYAQRLRELMVA